jgi:hypothetical protein
MDAPLFETDFDVDDVSEASIHIIENYTGIPFTQVERIEIIEAGKRQPNILDGLDAANSLLWFDYKGHLANTLIEVSKLVPDVPLKVTRAVHKSGMSYRPPVPDHTRGIETYELEYSLGDDGHTFHDSVDAAHDRFAWFETFLARIAAHSSYSFIPLVNDAESIYIRCTAEKFREYYPDYSARSQKVFDAPTPDVSSGTYKSLPFKKPLKYKVFYKPLLYSMIDGKACVLSYSSKTEVPIGERVQPGQSIEDAINRNLKTTFAYKGKYEIKSFTVSGTALDNKGVRILRFSSVIKLLDPLDLTSHPFGYRLEWDGTSGNNFESMKALAQGDASS